MATSDDFFKSFVAEAPPQSLRSRTNASRPPPPPPPPAVTTAADAAAIETTAAAVKKPHRVSLVRNINSTANGQPRSSSSLPTAAAPVPATATAAVGVPQRYSHYNTTTTISNANVTAAPPYSSIMATQPTQFYKPTTTTTAPAVMNPYLLSTPNTITNSSNTAATSNRPTKTATTRPSQPPSSGGLEGVMDGTATTKIFNPVMTGPMDNSAPSMQYYSYGAPAPYTMDQSAANIITSSSSSTNTMMMDGNNMTDWSDEPPLLEELGIHMDHIVAKTRAVVLPFQRFGGDMDAAVIQDADLYGPLVLGLLLGGELLLAGKIQFGYIYGFGLFGCCSMTVVLNLMTPREEAISMWTVTSILGYALLPVNLLAAIKLIVLIHVASLQRTGRVLGVITVVWSTVAATRLLEQGCGMRDQRYLIAYPIALLYSAFVMITIF